MINARNTRLVCAIVAVAPACLLLGCGIDQGGARIELPPTAAASRTIVVMGPITGFGSVLVNGLRLDTTGAQIRIDGSPAAQADLREGQVIRAIAEQQGSLLRASLIEHEQNLVGPIDALDAVNGELTVLGQPVRADASTVYQSPLTNGLSDLSVGDRIAVSGLSLASGEILATYIAAAAPTAALQVSATITGTDIPSLRFDIGALTVDYSQAAVLDLANGLPAADVVVEVRGTTLSGGILIADQVRALTLVPGLFSAAATSLTGTGQSGAGPVSTAGGLAANFVGFVTDANLPGRITLGDVDVLLSATTSIVGGGVNDLLIGARLLVEGDVSAFGQIEADRITIF
jgi:hypothetical protein